MNEKRLYLYILGSDNEEDRIKTAVPYKINENELFFGPCKKGIREELWKEFLKGNREKVNLEEKNIEIYLVGINPAKVKNKPRKLLFAGKIKEIFTFKAAWNNYANSHDPSIEKMINRKKSPLHLKPIDKGYKHLTEEHNNSWIEDITSKNLNGEKAKRIYSRGFIKRCEALFDRDCCFSMKNIFCSLNGKNMIPINEELIKIIKHKLKKDNQIKRLKTHIGPDIYAPFGYCSNGDRYGRGFNLVFENDEVDNILALVYDVLN